MKRRDFLKLLPLAAAAPAVAKGLTLPPSQPIQKAEQPACAPKAEVLPSAGPDILAEVTLHRPIWGGRQCGKTAWTNLVMEFMREQQKLGHSFEAHADLRGVVIDPVRIPWARAEELMNCFNERSIFMLTPEIRTYV